MNEFELIRRFFYRDIEAEWCVLGPGDDAAIIHPPKGQQLLLSSDTLIAGRHFALDCPPQDVGYKSLAVNLSDMAAMGARPMGFLLNISLPELDESWIERFARGLFAQAVKYDLALLGGDTTRGPLSISITILGCAEPGKILRRDAAEIGDVVAVLGELGGAALALERGKDASASLLDCLLRPRPRVAEGLQLAELAHAAIDISDGLAADLGHILEQSGVGAVIDLSHLPLHPEVAVLGADEATRLALHGGDEYTLCVTLDRAGFESALKAGLDLTAIGEIVREPGLFARDAETGLSAIPLRGYDHFA